MTAINLALPWIITALTVTAVFYLNQSDHKGLQRLLNWFPAILFAYVIPAIISAIGGLDFSEHSIHQFSKSFLIPLAILTVMSSLSINQLKAMGWRPIGVFISGSLWIALFPVAFVWLFSGTPLVEEFLGQKLYWKGLPPIVGSWIGGSTSQIVLKELVACPENIFLSILIIDNILVNIWTILMFQFIKKTDWIDQRLAIQPRDKITNLNDNTQEKWSSLMVLGILFTIVLLTNLGTDQLIHKIILLSLFGLALGNYLPGWPFRFILRFGGLLILAVMAILGLKLSFDQIQMDVNFLAFLVAWLMGHFIFMLLIAKILNISSVWVPIASMANVGGIATAPAVTSAYQKSLMPHAILLAVLSMVTGTFWGMLTIFLLQNLMS